MVDQTIQDSKDDGEEIEPVRLEITKLVDEWKVRGLAFFLWAICIILVPFKVRLGGHSDASHPGSVTINFAGIFPLSDVTVFVIGFE